MKINGLVFLSITLFLFTNCKYEKEEVVAPLTSVSFNSTVAPLLNTSCSAIGCHSAGGQTPDLTTANSYTSLVDGGYVDTVTIENSGIYLRMIDKQKPMPPNGVLSQSQINIIYSWIKEGAPNN